MVICDTTKKRREYYAQYYIDNREKILTRQKEYYHANREARNVYDRQWRVANKKRVLVQQKEYHITRREAAYAVLGPRECAECSRASGLQVAHIGGLRGEKRKITMTLYNWIINNPEEAVKRYRILCANHNHLERGANEASSGVQRHRRAMKRLGGICVWCGEADIRVLTKDHIHDDGSSDLRDNTTTDTYILNADLEEVLETFQCLCHACQLEKERERRKVDDLGIPILKSGEDM